MAPDLKVFYSCLPFLLALVSMKTNPSESPFSVSECGCLSTLGPPLPGKAWAAKVRSASKGHSHRGQNAGDKPRAG